MDREIDGFKWFAWRPVLAQDGALFAWLRWVWCRKEFIGPRCARVGDLDLMVWRYYRDRPPHLYWWQR